MSFFSRGTAAAVAEAARVDPAADASPGTSSRYRCESETLLRYLDRLIEQRRSGVRGAKPAAPGGAGLAVFFVELRRSDRTQALAGVRSARDAIELIVQCLGDILQPGDLFALYGVDELLIVLPSIDSEGRAMALASPLVRRLRESMLESGNGCRVRPSVGCAIYPAHGSDPVELIAAADRASRAARTIDEGYQIAMRRAPVVETAELSEDLEAALSANQLQVWLQPQLNLRTGLFDAAEALIRWPRPDGLPPVSPIVTVELAEAQGLMPRLTDFVLHTVLRQSAEFARRGIDLRIAINVSASMLTEKTNLPYLVKDKLELWDVKPDRLTLEVTENTLMDDVEQSLSILHQLKGVGTHLSLDDFGTGYSSFAYLRRMPLDELKIDQLFVRNLSVLADGSVNPQRDGDLRIVRSIIDISHNFDLHAVAEGVEDADTLALLESLGCDVIQGYFTGRPMPIPNFEAWWRERAVAVSALAPR